MSPAEELVKSVFPEAEIRFVIVSRDERIYFVSINGLRWSGDYDREDIQMAWREASHLVQKHIVNCLLD